MVRIAIAIVVLFLAPVLAHPLDVPVIDLAAELGADFQWEPYRRIGTLGLGTTRVMFRPDSDGLIVNYTEERKAKFAIRDGELFASEAASAVLREVFSAYRVTDGPRISAVVIDPGHGGKDPGTNHSHRIDDKTIHLVEKDIVLFVSRLLQEQLQSRFLDKDIILTRSDDRYIELEERVQIANTIELSSETDAVIFVSVHANASLRPASYGYEVWYLPPEYGRGDLVAEELEGANTQDLRSILNTMKDEEFTVESVLLARNILDGLDGEIGESSKNLGLKEESWFVVRNAKMPSVLVELGFITNPEEAKMMSDQLHLRKMVAGLYNGIADFVEQFESKKGFTE
jgi:N-acetylmuramoyl-L-alanine amidase